MHTQKQGVSELLSEYSESRFITNGTYVPRRDILILEFVIYCSSDTSLPTFATLG